MIHKTTFQLARFNYREIDITFSTLEKAYYFMLIFNKSNPDNKFTEIVVLDNDEEAEVLTDFSEIKDKPNFG